MNHDTLLVDLVFKKLFGVEENKDLLMDFINSLVSEEDQVTSVALINSYKIQIPQTENPSSLVVKSESHCGKQYIIQIQMTDHLDCEKIALSHWVKLYTDELSAGEDSQPLNKVIVVNILNTGCIVGTPNYHHVFHVTEKESGIQYFKGLELHTIELKKFERDIGDDFSKLMEKMKSKVDIWCAFFTKSDLLRRNKKEIPTNPEYQSLKKALDVIEVMNFGSDEREVDQYLLKLLREPKRCSIEHLLGLSENPKVALPGTDALVNAYPQTQKPLQEKLMVNILRFVSDALDDDIELSAAFIMQVVLDVYDLSVRKAQGKKARMDKDFATWHCARMLAMQKAEIKRNQSAKD